MRSTKLPVMILRNLVLFPYQELRIEFDELVDKELISLSENNYFHQFLVVTPLNTLEINPDITDLPSVGVVGNIKIKMEMPNGKTRIVIEGYKRVLIDNYELNDKYYIASVSDISYENFDSIENDAYVRTLLKKLNRYVKQAPYMSNAVLSQINGVENIDRLTDIIASMFPIQVLNKYKYIEELQPENRVKMLIKEIEQDLKLVALEKKIDEKVSVNLEDSQKEYVLREKLKVIKQELGEVNDKEDEINSMNQKLNSLKAPNKVKSRIKHEINRYSMTSPNSQEVGIIRDYIDWLMKLPWNKMTKDNTDLFKAKDVLDTTHYGLDKVKGRILEYLAVKQNTNSLRSPILCLVGPPGVGKTSLANSIAQSLNRHVTKISVGGIHDEAEILGHRRTYVASLPGRVIQGMKKAGSSNPVFIIDEIDKMTKDIKGDPASALLEILDPEQNSKFIDHYIEEEFDLSKVFFIATANYIDKIPNELRDRLEIIEISSYTEYEKVDIMRNYILPRQLMEHGLTQIQVQFEDEVYLELIRYYTKEAGVRELERVIASLLRKIVKELLMNKEIAFFNVDVELVLSLLGKRKYSYTEKADGSQIGVVNGMAYTYVGGDILPIESTFYKGKGELILTGSLGNVMQESAHLAFSYIKSNVFNFNLSMDDIENNDIHIHLPEGAINKDGPSAGVALATSLISLLKNMEVSSNIAMTGELTLRGKVLPIGGLKEKIIGAHRSGVRIIFLPRENEVDLDDIPFDVIKEMKFIFVDNYSEIYERIFIQNNSDIKERIFI